MEEYSLNAVEGEVVGCRNVGGAASWRLAGCRLAAIAVGLRLTV